MSSHLPLDPGTRKRIDRLGKEFLADFYRRETSRHPENLEALSELAHLLTQLGRLEEGLAVDQLLVKAMPDSDLVHYNHACSLALSGLLVEAMDALELAIELGYDDAPHLDADEDFACLQKEPRFQRLLRRLYLESEL
ncbi:MAG: Flp pilus assembly protein TadD [Planctomycetota bacterium]|jgi:Flp pilus assembly protein TadD